MKLQIVLFCMTLAGLSTGALSAKGDVTRKISKRDADITVQKWNNIKAGDNYIIPYVIDSSIGTQGKAAIQAAVADFKSKTCLRFQERKDEKDYITFFKGSGCWSYVGKWGRKYQKVSIGRGCESKGTVIHELIHALGFWHEQSRPDRDEYVRINWDNIIEDGHSQFNKKKKSQIDYMGSPYDYKSVMHYNSYAFSANRKPTIVDLNGKTIPTQNDEFSEQDLFQLNKMYGCKKNTVITTTIPATTTTIPASTTTIPASTTTTPCEDKNKNCKAWAASGECNINPDYMRPNCCKSCSSYPCEDKNENCESWASRGQCDINPTYMRPNCCKSCSRDLCQNNDEYKHCDYWAKHSANYCEHETYSSFMTLHCCKSCISVQCLDQNQHCKSWAARGECTRNPGYMTTKCCKSCTGK